MKTPETDNLARGNHVVPTEWAEQLERERDEAREALKKIKHIFTNGGDVYVDFVKVGNIATDYLEGLWK